MKHISVLMKPASSLCNLRCRYCFYADVSSNREVCSYGVMEPRTAEAVIEHILADLTAGDCLTVAFQGGEPTLAGLPCLAHIADHIERNAAGIQVSYALQTNGTLLDDSWCAFLKERGFLVGLSLDGPAAIHNRNRVDGSGKGSYQAVIDAKKLLERYGVEYNILSVLTNETARHAQQIWSYIMEQNIQYVQFIPCLDPLDGPGQAWALTPKRFYSFYSGLYQLWHSAVERGRYVSVKLFDDIANLFLFHKVTACGLNGRCNLQYVIEADGSVYPCDFYVLDRYFLGNLREDTLRQIRARYEALGFLSECGGLPDICTGCRYQSACCGGCRRMERHMYVEGTFCGYRALLDEIMAPLCRDIQRLYIQ